MLCGMAFPLEEQPEFVQRRMAVAAARDLQGLRDDIALATADVPEGERPFVASSLVTALDRFVDSYATQFLE